MPGQIESDSVFRGYSGVSVRTEQKSRRSLGSNVQICGQVFENRGAGFSPSRHLTDPACAIAGSIEMTG
jgi:hypothetical protein